MIEFNGVAKTYDTGQQVLHDVNLQIHQGELIVLIGPSGCGKTTTMKMINRLVTPTKGTIYIDNQDISQKDPVTLRRNIGYVIQNIGLLPHMTIEENVALVPKLKKWDADRYRRRVRDLMQMVNLDPDQYAQRYPAELSGGQQQRIGVIRAMAADPPIILMDEPFSALDPISREQLQDELVRLQETIRKTIVFVTHDIDEAIKIGNRICIMNEGRIIQFDTPEQILRHPVNEFVRGFIGENRLQLTDSYPDIADIMVKPIISGPDRGLAAAIRVMRMKKVDTLLIVDSEGRLLGKASVWDIHKHYQDENITLQDVLQPANCVVEVAQPLAEAIRLISQHKIAYLPVVDKERKLLGVITRASLVDIMAENFAEDA
ncbi:Choline transport ATP-binding protein OpuBA [Propionispora sp. 2/2-37]|uniref:ABC transporter ATP-binding protein n=1 Tax=Propionispora sp. 2/2-37 TaxID=1677858 RepID=UPI0006BB5DED|nr:betaine/proline/choline family ABC transporter ATP-binding protein [Propionispora sp. 2/2-37]CUH94969.1 Choline transport ATP-binding protein OpuBA [Propionispora sp. 2/2-37]